MSGNVKRARRRSSYRKPSEWQKSASFRYMAADAITAYNRKRHLLPKCGAKCRTGDLCGNLAMENGRCWRHGGLTPTGKDWGKRQVKRKPHSRGRVSDWRKLEAKLKQQERDDKERVRRLAAMTDADFEVYARRMGRRLSGKIGDMVDREARRRQRTRDLASPARAIPVNPAVEALGEEIARLQRLKAATDLPDNEPDQGVFG